MRIIFVGTVNFSLQLLQTAIDERFDIVGVVTSSDKSINADYSELKPICDLHHLPTIAVTDINSSQSLNWVRAKSPDLIFCFGWSRLIKAELLQIPRYGVVGYHPSALPRIRVQITG